MTLSERMMKLTRRVGGRLSKSVYISSSAILDTDENLIHVFQAVAPTL